MVTLVDKNKIDEVLKYCPYYDEIINSYIDLEDELSYDLIDWYKEFIFSSNLDNDSEMKIVKEIDRSMYLYISNYKYKVDLKNIISIKDIDLNSNKSIKKLIKKIINYTNRYENNELFNITRGRWI